MAFPRPRPALRGLDSEPNQTAWDPEAPRGVAPRPSSHSRVGMSWTAGFPAWTRTPVCPMKVPRPPPASLAAVELLLQPDLPLFRKHMRGTGVAHAGTSVSRSVRRGRICLFKALVAFAVSSRGWPGGPSLTLFAPLTASFLPFTTSSPSSCSNQAASASLSSVRRGP